MRFELAPLVDLVRTSEGDVVVMLLDDRIAALSAIGGAIVEALAESEALDLQQLTSRLVRKYANPTESDVSAESVVDDLVSTLVDAGILLARH